MITIIRGRDSGKAKELLEAARKNNAAIITQDKRAFRVKAQGYGFDDIEILDYRDLLDGDYDEYKPVLIHNGDKFLYWMLSQDFGLETLGFTATITERD